MKASVPGTNVGLNDVNYSPIKVGDTLRHPDTHMTLKVDRYGHILDSTGSAYPHKDNYYLITEHAKAPWVRKAKAANTKMHKNTATCEDLRETAGNCENSAESRNKIAEKCENTAQDCVEARETTGDRKKPAAICEDLRGTAGNCGEPEEITVEPAGEPQGAPEVTLDTFSDAELAAELRHRGYTLHAVKEL